MQERRIRPATAEAVTIVPLACFWCFGTGRVPNDHHERFDRCEPCGGTGVRKSSPGASGPTVSRPSRLWPRRPDFVRAYRFR